MAGRPSKLNEELIEKIGKEIEEGLPVEYACNLLSISGQSYYNWMNQGELDFNNEVESLYALFFETIKKAYAIYVKKSRDIIHHGTNGWQGRAWWLERTNSKFMPRQQIQADDDGKVTVVIGGKEKKVKDANNK